jgi:hypothetical protein
LNKVVIFAAILTLCVSGAYAALTLPMDDTFDASGATYSWSYYGGVFNAAGATDRIVNYQGQDCLAVEDGSMWQFVYPTDDEGNQAASVIVEAWQYLGSTIYPIWARVGVGVRAQGTGWADGANSGYWVYSDTDTDGYFSVGVGFKNWSGPPNIRLYGPTTCSRDVWHHWAIGVDGNSLVAYSDTEGAYGEVYSLDISTLDGGSQWANGYVGIANVLVGATTDYSYTDRIIIQSYTPVDNWSLLE